MEPSSVRVIGDVHGHRTELVAALQAAGLIDAHESWSGKQTRLWFLGDFFDRGPDGIGVLDLVMRLSAEAAATDGSVRALLGNHEILTLGMHLFGDKPSHSDFGPTSFARSWLLNGGQESDQKALTTKHIDWLIQLPVLAHDKEHVLMHSDTIEYFGWGETVEEINNGVHDVLSSSDLSAWWECWRRLTTRYAFRGPHGAEIATEVLSLLGGKRIVHGHSVIADQLGIHPTHIEAPYLYAGGKVLGIDGGLFLGGPCLIVPLPWTDPENIA